MKTNKTLSSEPAPRNVLGIPAKARIQWSPKTFIFGLTTFWVPAAACPGEGQGRNDGKKLTGQQ